MESFTDEQVSKARHALGLTRQKIAFRNYYTALDDPEWNDLVERGFAAKRKSPVSLDSIYNLTKRAAFFFLNVGESVDPELRFPTECCPACGGEGRDLRTQGSIDNEDPQSP